MSDAPRTLIVRSAGTNCDAEMRFAFEQAGASTEAIHVNRLIEQPSVFERVDLVGFPGGFSYGDDIAAGRILANRLRQKLLDPIRAAVERGVPMIGVCNGFQVLVKMGLLPEPTGEQAATLADNLSGRFVDRWVGVRTPVDTCCVWTRGLGEFELPVAHGEGRFVPRDGGSLQRWRERGQIALTYAPDDNPNGSADDVAGICDPTGLVLGLMPHPERFVQPTQHPAWTRRRADGEAVTPRGLDMFQNAVNHVKAKGRRTAEPRRPSERLSGAEVSS